MSCEVIESTSYVLVISMWRLSQVTAWYTLSSTQSTPPSVHLVLPMASILAAAWLNPWAHWSAYSMLLIQQLHGAARFFQCAATETSCISITASALVMTQSADRFMHGVRAADLFHSLLRVC
jgi:hypothetical protein